jgi:Domain of unknown function (DUF4349)/Putative zinc-finger
MNSMTHPVAPEEIMALLDGELTAAEAKAVQAHIDECAECAALRDDIRGTSEALHAWAVPELSAESVRAVEDKIERADAKSKAMKPQSYTALSFLNWRLWAIGGGGAAVAIAVLVAVASVLFYRVVPHESRMTGYINPQQSDVDTYSYAPAQQDARSEDAARGGVRQRKEARAEGMETLPLRAGQVSSLTRIAPGVSGEVAPPPPPVPGSAAPMIARSVAITVLVKNIEAARRNLDDLLAKHGGYAAQLTINTPENGARSFQSSLRVPAGELATALTELRGLGRVQTETQSGEEVTQQHTDLAARLTNARETETRLRAILLQRTGKMEDVLEVEEKISETRGEIEQMEAEQKALEHRVAFASVELQLTEQYKAQLGEGAPQSVGTEMHNALVAGLRNAGGSLLGLVLFFEEYGPALVLWTVLLGGPVWLVWRIRRRRNAGQ